MNSVMARFKVERLVTTLEVLHQLPQPPKDVIEDVATLLREEAGLHRWLELREMPYSEVCIHMRVAGKLMWVERTVTKPVMAQLYLLDGVKFSFPITAGEAGLYQSGLQVA